MLYHVLGTFFIFLVILVISFFFSFFWGGKSPKIFEPGYMLCTFFFEAFR